MDIISSELFESVALGFRYGLTEFSGLQSTSGINLSC